LTLILRREYLKYRLLYRKQEQTSLRAIPAALSKKLVNFGPLTKRL